MKKIAILGLMVLGGAAYADELYNNGPVVGPRGISFLARPATTYGFGDQASAGNAVADDFTVTGTGWNVTDIDLYGYQTGATSFGFTDVTWSIVSGDVNSGTIVASGTTAVTDGGVVGYRIGIQALNRDRAIYDIKADIPDVTLAAGTYWLTWSLNGDPSFSGPWQPPTSDRRVGDAQQAVSFGTYAPLTEAGSGQGVDLPFVLNGTVAAVPEPATLLSLSAGLVLLGALRRRRRD